MVFFLAFFFKKKVSFISYSVFPLYRKNYFSDPSLGGGKIEIKERKNKPLLAARLLTITPLGSNEIRKKQGTSIKECALFFKVSERTIIRRLSNNSLVEYENKNLILKNNT